VDVSQEEAAATVRSPVPSQADKPFVPQFRRDTLSRLLQGNHAFSSQSSELSYSQNTNPIELEDNDGDLLDLQQRYEALEKLISALRVATNKIGQAASEAQDIYQSFEDILGPVEDTVRENRDMRGRWTVETAKNQAEKFRQFDNWVAGTMEKELIKPLVEEREAVESLKKAEMELAELSQRLKISS